MTIFYYFEQSVGRFLQNISLRFKQCPLWIRWLLWPMVLLLLIVLFFWVWPRPWAKVDKPNRQINPSVPLTVLYKSVAEGFSLNLPAAEAKNYSVSKIKVGNNLVLEFSYSVNSVKQPPLFQIIMEPFKDWSRDLLKPNQLVLGWSQNWVFVWQPLSQADNIKGIADSFVLDPVKQPPVLSYKVYFGNSKKNKAADCSLVYPVERKAQPVGSIVDQALRQLLQGPTVLEKNQGFNSWFSAATANYLRSLRVSRGVVYVDFLDWSQLMPGANSSCGSQELLAELQATLLQFPIINQVVFASNGSPAAFYQWLQLSCPQAAGDCSPAAFLQP